MRAERRSEVVATIIGDKVEVKALCTAGQIEFDRSPPIVIIPTSIFMLIIYCALYRHMQILKRDIDNIILDSMNDISDLICMYPPQLIIYTKNVDPSTEPRIQVIGLDRECIYNRLPSENNQ